MPHVDIRVIGPAPTADQKRTLFVKMTDLMVNILGRTRKLVMVSVRSNPMSDWSVAGTSPDDPGAIGVQAIVHVPAGAVTEQQKAQMIAESTSVLRSVLGAPVFPLYVLFQETPPVNWGYDGRTLAAITATKAQ